MPKSDLTRALEALTLQLKRFNDANEPRSRHAGDAELFRAGDAAELEARELHEQLEALEEAGSEGGQRRSPAGQRKRR